MFIDSGRCICLYIGFLDRVCDWYSDQLFGPESAGVNSVLRFNQQDGGNVDRAIVGLRAALGDPHRNTTAPIPGLGRDH